VFRLRGKPPGSPGWLDWHFLRLRMRKEKRLRYLYIPIDAFDMNEIEDMFLIVTPFASRVVGIFVFERGKLFTMEPANNFGAREEGGEEGW
jgi:hypothetical protein